MKAVYQQRGETIDFVNNTGATILANDVVTLTNRIGVAATEIPAGAKGSVHVTGVFSVPAETVNAFTVGQTVYLSGETVVTATDGGIVAGFVVEPKTASGAIAYVKIG